MLQFVAVLFVCSLLVAQEQPATAPPPVPDQPAAPEPAASGEAAVPQLAGLKYATGTVAIADLATIAMPEGWRYLAGKDAHTVLEDVWGNPPNDSVLGIAFPPGGGPLDSYAVVVSYRDEGYVEDDDAAGTDFDALLHEMQEDARSANAERQKRGYPTVELLGWAEPPHYDAQEKKLYWAKQLRFEGAEDVQLNYDVRILGRNGHLVMTAVGAASDLIAIAAGCKELLRVTEFVPGKRYENFDPAYDKIAAYGIGGLVAGKLLLKAGLFKVLLKPLLLVGALLIGWLARAFGRRKPVPAATGAPSA